jgi:hypothetical protein
MFLSGYSCLSFYSLSFDFWRSINFALGTASPVVFSPSHSPERNSVFKQDGWDPNLFFDIAFVHYALSPGSRQA